MSLPFDTPNSRLASCEYNRRSAAVFSLLLAAQDESDHQTFRSLFVLLLLSRPRCAPPPQALALASVKPVDLCSGRWARARVGG